MTIKYNFPDCFAPDEKEFQIFCSIKLLKSKYINKIEAMDICGFSGNEEIKFDQLLNSFEKYYKTKCGRVYTDLEWEEDPKER